MPTISERELQKFKNRTGVYSGTRNQSSLKSVVIGLVQQAFLEYARKHGCKPESERLEWQRFEKILQKHL